MATSAPSTERLPLFTRRFTKTERNRVACWEIALSRWEYYTVLEVVSGERHVGSVCVIDVWLLMTLKSQGSTVALAIYNSYLITL